MTLPIRMPANRYADKLKGLVAMGVDCFKTDFGERIQPMFKWFDGSDSAENA